MFVKVVKLFKKKVHEMFKLYELFFLIVKSSIYFILFFVKIL